MINDLAPFPMPHKDDELFRAVNPMADARLTPWLGTDLPFREGYRRGALRLAEYVCQNALEQDFLVYPIMYLYRHHVELALKRLLRSAAALADEDLDEQTLKHLAQHRLDLLWADLRPLLTCERSGVQLNPSESDGIDAYILQLTQNDRDGEASRYPCSKDGRILLAEGPAPINIAHFAEKMERLCNSLEGLDSFIDDQLDSKHEMASEAGVYCDD